MSINPYLLSEEHIQDNAGMYLYDPYFGSTRSDAPYVSIHSVDLIEDGTDKAIIKYQLIHEEGVKKRATPLFEIEAGWIFDRQEMEHKLNRCDMFELTATAGAVCQANGLDVREFSRAFEPSYIDSSIRQARELVRPLERLVKSTPDNAGTNAVIDSSHVSINTFSGIEEYGEDDDLVIVKADVGGTIIINMDGFSHNFDTGDEVPVSDLTVYIEVEAIARFEVDVNKSTIEFLDIEDDSSSIRDSTDHNVSLDSFGGLEKFLGDLNLTEMLMTQSEKYADLIPIAEMAYTNEATTLKQLSLIMSVSEETMPFIPDGFRINLSSQQEVDVFKGVGDGSANDIAVYANQAILALERSAKTPKP